MSWALHHSAMCRRSKLVCCSQTSHFDEVIGDVDVVHMLLGRSWSVWKEPLFLLAVSTTGFGALMNAAKADEFRSTIRHPDRGMEINSEVADCARLASDQVNAGVLTRSRAAMYLLLGVRLFA